MGTIIFTLFILSACCSLISFIFVARKEFKWDRQWVFAGFILMLIGWGFLTRHLINN